MQVYSSLCEVVATRAAVAAGSRRRETLDTGKRGRRNVLSRLWRFWLRRRARRDQEYIAVLSEPSGAKDVHDARLAHQANAGRQAKEAPRGLNG